MVVTGCSNLQNQPVACLMDWISRLSDELLLYTKSTAEPPVEYVAVYVYSIRIALIKLY